MADNVSSGYKLRKLMENLLGPTDSTAANVDLVDKMTGTKRSLMFFVEAGASDTAVPERVIYTNTTGFTQTLTAAYVNSAVSVATNASNYRNVVVYKRTAADGSQTTLGNVLTRDTALTARVDQALTLSSTASDLEIATTANVTCEMTDVGTSPAIGPSMIRLELTTR